MDKTAKERMRRHRNKKRNETPNNVTVSPDSVTQSPDSVTAGVTVLSDGQVLDRANRPVADLTLWPGWKIEALKRCNQADKMKPLMGYEALEVAKEMQEVTR